MMRTVWAFQRKVIEQASKVTILKIVIKTFGQMSMDFDLIQTMLLFGNDDLDCYWAALAVSLSERIFERLRD